MSGQGKLTIEQSVGTNSMWRTVRSARKHGVMRTVARCAQRLFGHRSHVGALRWRMSRRWENDARWNIGTFPTKRQRKKGKEIERRCACRRNRWQWQNPCREAFERCESWRKDGMYAGTTDAMEANGGRQRSNSKCLRPECLVEAAAKDFESFDDWKAGCNAGTAKAYRHRPNNRGLCRQTAGEAF